MNNEFISIMTERIVRDFDPLQIILFGSQARGDSDRNSDIDLLVVFSELTDKRKTALDILRALSDLPVAKDILVSTPEELEHHRTRIGSVLRYAQQEGKILCGKDLNAPVRRSTQHSVLPIREVKHTMQVNDQFQNTSRWLRYAEEDLIAAETLLKQPHLPPRHACWYAQQATEKALKAVLIFLEIDFPRTHDLDALRNLIPDSWHLKIAHPDLSDLTRWAVESRYPEDIQETTNANASKAVEQARAVWTSVSTELTRRGFHVENAV